MINLLYVLISALVSGIGATIISNYYYNNMLKKKERRELLAKFFEYKNGLNSSDLNEKAKFTNALNKVFVVFYDNKDVIDCMNNLYISAIQKDPKIDDCLVNLILTMTKDRYVDMGSVQWTKDSILRTFS